jgi:hypothetical protein
VLIDEPKFIEIIAERSKRARPATSHGQDASAVRRASSGRKRRARGRDVRAG